jgi:hypothetical protein
MTPVSIHAVLRQLDLVGRHLQCGQPRDALYLLQGIEQEVQRMVEGPVRVDLGTVELVTATVGED